MLKNTEPKPEEGYAVYYRVCGSLAGNGQLAQEYLWDGIVFPTMKEAVEHAQKLSAEHQNDPSFIVKSYRK